MCQVLVLGVTGDQGHPLITRLLVAGLTPVAALRTPNAFQGTEFAHLEVVETDLFDEYSVVAAAESVEAIAAHLPLVFDLEAVAVQNWVRKVVSTLVASFLKKTTVTSRTMVAALLNKRL